MSSRKYADYQPESGLTDMGTSVQSDVGTKDGCKALVESISQKESHVGLRKFAW